MKLPRKPKIIAGIVVVLLAVVLIFTVVRDDAKQPDLTNNRTSRGDPIDSSQPVNEFDKSKYPLDDPSSIWVIVNKDRPLKPLDYAPGDLTNAGGSQQLRAEAANALIQMFAAGRLEKIHLQALSGYRSYSRQKVVYQNEVNAYGQAKADTESAKPGYSEHQTGYAIDVGGGGCGIEDCFGKTKEGKWLAASAYKYGFLIRYPEGKESVTGYRYEPWHIRYVGVELATEMHNKNIATLEEFFEL